MKKIKKVAAIGAAAFTFGGALFGFAGCGENSKKEIESEQPRLEQSLIDQQEKINNQQKTIDDQKNQINELQTALDDLRTQLEASKSQADIINNLDIVKANQLSQSINLSFKELEKQLSKTKNFEYSKLQESVDKLLNEIGSLKTLAESSLYGKLILEKAQELESKVCKLELTNSINNSLKEYLQITTRPGIVLSGSDIRYSSLYLSPDGSFKEGHDSTKLNQWGKFYYYKDGKTYFTDRTVSESGIGTHQKCYVYNHLKSNLCGDIAPIKYFNNILEETDWTYSLKDRDRWNQSHFTLKSENGYIDINTKDGILSSLKIKTNKDDFNSNIYVGTKENYDSVYSRELWSYDDYKNIIDSFINVFSEDYAMMTSSHLQSNGNNREIQQVSSSGNAYATSDVLNWSDGDIWYHYNYVENNKLYSKDSVSSTGEVTERIENDRTSNYNAYILRNILDFINEFDCIKLNYTLNNTYKIEAVGEDTRYSIGLDQTGVVKVTETSTTSTDKTEYTMESITAEQFNEIYNSIKTDYASLVSAENTLGL